MTHDEFDGFFEAYAGNVEGFYEASYWLLADELIKELVRRHLGLSAGQRLLDAGGGTGRWALWYASEFAVEVTIADKSRRMLRQAQHVIAAAGLSRPPRLVECDLCDAPELDDEAYDAIVSTYGVLSFLDDPASAFRTLFRVLRPGGRALLMGHSLSNALSSKLSSGLTDFEEVTGILRTSTVLWAPHVPRLRVFSARDLRSLAEQAGFTTRGIFGITSIVQPGPEDWGYPYTTISSISRRLEDPAYFKQALEIELDASERPEWAERAVNLMLYVQRPEPDDGRPDDGC